MLLKLIRCEVASEHRDAFADGQGAWAATAQSPGFVHQGGGWAEEDAWIVSWWRDWDAYAQFRAQVHDHLAARSGQSLTSQETEVSYWATIAEEHVDRRGSADLQPAPALWQVEQLELAHGCLPEFREFLTWRWRAALAGAPGLHEAWLCRHRKRPGSFLIWSSWDQGQRAISLASLLHPGYRVPQRRLQLLRSHEVARIPLEEAWQVGRDSAGSSAFLTQEDS